MRQSQLNQGVERGGDEPRPPMRTRFARPSARIGRGPRIEFSMGDGAVGEAGPEWEATPVLAPADD